MSFQGNIKFRDIADFLDHLSSTELEIVEQLREIILETIPFVKEKLSYNVPFYSVNKRICYIWPASVPWGKIPEKAVALGFTKGRLIPDAEDILIFDDRKHVGVMYFKTALEINLDLIRALLYDAFLLDSKQSD